MLLLAAIALSAQDTDLTQLLDRADEVAPAPNVAEIRPLALDRLQAAATQQQACVPDGVALEAPRSASATPLIVRGIRTRQVRNAWLVYGQALGCPGSPRTRFMVLAMPDNQYRVVVVNVGESLANPSLMQQASQAAANAALIAVRRGEPSCNGNDMDMASTRVVARGPSFPDDWHGVYFSGSWQEAWTFTTCGRRAEVPITFTADGAGGANFQIGANEIRVVP